MTIKVKDHKVLELQLVEAMMMVITKIISTMKTQEGRGKMENAKAITGNMNFLKDHSNNNE